MGILVECPAGHRFLRKGKACTEVNKTMFCPLCGFRVTIMPVTNTGGTGSTDGGTATGIGLFSARASHQREGKVNESATRDVIPKLG